MVLYGPPTALPECGGLQRLQYGCQHLQATSINYGIKPHSNVTFNPDTVSALMITTLALRKDIHLYQEP